MSRGGRLAGGERSVNGANARPCRRCLRAPPPRTGPSSRRPRGSSRWQWNMYGRVRVGVVGEPHRSARTVRSGRQEDGVLPARQLAAAAARRRPSSTWNWTSWMWKLCGVAVVVADLPHLGGAELDDGVDAVHVHRAPLMLVPLQLERPRPYASSASRSGGRCEPCRHVGRRASSVVRRAAAAGCRSVVRPPLKRSTKASSRGPAGSCAAPVARPGRIVTTISARSPGDSVTRSVVDGLGSSPPSVPTSANGRSSAKPKS